MRKEENYLLLPDLVFTEVERIDADPPVGGEGEALNLRLNYRLRAGVLSTSSLYKWLRRYLQQAIPPGFVQHGEGITIRDLQVHGRDLRHSELYVQAAVKIRGQIDRRQLFQAIAGKTLDEAQFELAGFPEISQVKFRNASRVQRVPTRSFQVRFWCRWRNKRRKKQKRTRWRKEDLAIQVFRIPPLFWHLDLGPLPEELIPGGRGRVDQVRPGSGG